MTTHMDLTEMLSRTRVLLLDFDGPVCSIFSALPAPAAATRLSRLIAEHLGEPHPMPTDDDPLALLNVVAQLDDAALLRRVEDELRRTEVEAAQDALPTPHAAEAMQAANAAGHQIAIVSNNSTEAIAVYLKRQALEPYVATVFGRPYAAPNLMKPNPHGLLTTMKAPGVQGNQSVLVDDSVSGMHAAKAAETYSIGFANRPEKAETLAIAGAHAVVEDMALISDAYSALSI